MADRQRHPDWWLASDGKWYPPELRTEEPVFAPDTWEPHAEPESESEDTVIPGALTRAVVWALMATSGLLAIAGSLSFWLASVVRSGADDAAVEEARLIADAWSGIGFMALFVAGGLVLVWTFRASRVVDARGATGRRWRGGWTIGSWFVPIASLVLPRLVFVEIEKATAVPYDDAEPIGDRWKSRRRSPVGDLWWLLWVGSLVILQVMQIQAIDAGEGQGVTAAVATLSGIGYLLLGAAGVLLAALARRIERTSRAGSMPL